MLTPFSGPLTSDCWTLRLPAGDYAFGPGADRAAGPVVFTSSAAAERWLQYHARRWGPLPGAQIVPLLLPLEALVTSLRGQPAPTTLYLDPRPAFGFGAEFDADTLDIQPDRATMR